METVAIIGASPKPERYSNKAQKMLSEYGHIPKPISPIHKEIEGTKAYRSLRDIPEKVDTVTMYVAPKHQFPELIDDIIEASPRRVIFNPGAENQTVYDRLRGQGIEVLEACTLVLLRTHQF